MYQEKKSVERLVHGWESIVLHCLLPLPLAYMLDMGLEKVKSSTFLSLETDKHLMKQNKCFKWLIALQLENDAISFLKKACWLQVFVYWMWEYRSRLSAEIQFHCFFRSIHFSGKMRPYEFLVVNSHLEWVCEVLSLSFFLFPFLLYEALLLYGVSKRRTWEEQWMMKWGFMASERVTETNFQVCLWVEDKMDIFGQSLCSLCWLASAAAPLERACSAINNSFAETPRREQIYWRTASLCGRDNLPFTVLLIEG